MNNFGYIAAMKVIFFSKCLKISVDLENQIKPSKKVDSFEDNFVSTCSSSFCELWQEYMWFVVNVFKSNPEISDPTERHDTQLNLLYVNGTLA